MALCLMRRSSSSQWELWNLLDSKLRPQDSGHLVRLLQLSKIFPLPQTTDIRSWFGLVNQVAYAFAQSKTMAPFREFLSSKTRKFLWDSTMDEIFRKSKEEIISLVNDGVRTFDPSLPTCLTTDWSKMGLDSHWCKSIARVHHLTTPIAVTVIGNSYLQVQDSLTDQKPDMPQLKENVWQLHTA